MSILIATTSRGNLVVAGLGLGQQAAPACRLQAQTQKLGDVRLE